MGHDLGHHTPFPHGHAQRQVSVGCSEMTPVLSVPRALRDRVRLAMVTVVPQVNPVACVIARPLLAAKAGTP